MQVEESPAEVVKVPVTTAADCDDAEHALPPPRARAAFAVRSTDTSRAVTPPAPSAIWAVPATEALMVPVSPATGPVPVALSATSSDTGVLAGIATIASAVPGLLLSSLAPE